MRAFLAVIVLVLGVALPFNLDVVKFAVVQALSSPCRLPKDLLPNVGQFVSLDLRHAGSGTVFVSAEPADWVRANSDVLAPLRSGSGDLIVYIHGFLTSMGDADCAAKSVAADLAERQPPESSHKPDVLVFGWPGETKARQFSRAQTAASQAAKYLADLLSQLRKRRIILIAHSLGAAVAMEALSEVPQTAESPSFHAIILIQGAIPVASLRTWSYKITVRFPAAETHDRIAGRKPHPGYIEEGEGVGCYVDAASKARHLIVTRSADDITLSRMYATDEMFVPGLCQGPRVFPVEGETVRTLPQTLAIGSGMDREEIFRIHRELMPEDPGTISDPWGAPENPGNFVPTLRPPDDSQVLLERAETYSFKIPHPSYHEIHLSRLSGWRPFFDWHSPLNYRTMRADLLGQIWHILDQRDGAAGPIGVPVNDQQDPSRATH